MTQELQRPRMQLSRLRQSPSFLFPCSSHLSHLLSIPSLSHICYSRSSRATVAYACRRPRRRFRRGGTREAQSRAIIPTNLIVPIPVSPLQHYSYTLQIYTLQNHTILNTSRVPALASRPCDPGFAVSTSGLNRVA